MVNTGNVTLPDLIIEDAFTVDELPAEFIESDLPEKLTLEKGATVVFTAKYLIASSDNTLKNVVVVGDNDHKDDVEITVEDNPEWTVVKSAENASGEKLYYVGDTVIYTIVVDNIGNVDLKGLTIVDVFAVDEKMRELEVTGESHDPAKFDIAQGETAVFTAQYQILPTDKYLMNVAAAIDEDEETEDPVSEEVITIVEDNPVWTVEKVSANANGSRSIEIGDTVVYTITIQNTGNVDLIDLSLIDTFTVDRKAKTLTLTSEEELDPNCFTIEKGASAVFTAEYKTGRLDKYLKNTADVNGVTDTVSDNVNAPVTAGRFPTCNVGECFD